MSIKSRRTLHVNSISRVDGADASNCYLRIDIPADAVFTHVVVEKINIPKTYYLIQVGFNTFTLRENGVDTVVALTPGNYTAAQFRTMCVAAMTGASSQGWVYAMTLNTSTGKFTYIVTGNGILQPTILAQDNVYEQLGFVINSTNTFVANTLVSTTVVNMQSEDTIFLHSDMVSGPDDVLQAIFINNVQDMATISYTCSSWQMSAKPFGMKGNTYHFSLEDENRRPLNLNGRNWVMELVLFDERQPLQLSL